MAKNEVSNATRRKLAVPSGTVSGDPVAVGSLVGVAETDRDSDGNAIVCIAPRIWRLSVKGVDGSGNSAVAVGDKLYYNSGDTPKINKKTAGVAFGEALEAVSSGATATIEVLVTQGL